MNATQHINGLKEIIEQYNQNQAELTAMLVIVKGMVEPKIALQIDDLVNKVRGVS